MSHCSQGSVRLEALEDQIDGYLSQIAIKEKYLQWALDTLKQQINDERSTWEQAGNSIGREEGKLKDQLSELNWFFIRINMSF